MFSVQKFLIVDDEPAFRGTLVKLLSVYAQISEAPTLKAAKELLEKEKFDVVLLDKKLPDGSGLEMVPFIQEVQPECAILIVSGDMNLAPIYQAIEHGIDDYVVKGDYTLQELLVRIPLAIRRHKDALFRDSHLKKASVDLPQCPSEVTPEGFQNFLSVSEKEYLERALQLSGFEVGAVAGNLGLARSTLHKKISDYSIRVN